jgi:hypothetical protein
VIQQGFAGIRMTHLGHDRVQITRQFVGSVSKHLNHTGGNFLCALRTCGRYVNDQV